MADTPENPLADKSKSLGQTTESTLKGAAAGGALPVIAVGAMFSEEGRKQAGAIMNMAVEGVVGKDQAEAFKRSLSAGLATTLPGASVMSPDMQKAAAQFMAEAQNIGGQAAQSAYKYSGLNGLSQLAQSAVSGIKQMVTGGDHVPTDYSAKPGLSEDVRKAPDPNKVPVK